MEKGSSDEAGLHTQDQMLSAALGRDVTGWGPSAAASPLSQNPRPKQWYDRDVRRKKGGGRISGCGVGRQKKKACKAFCALCPMRAATSRL